MVKDFQSKTGGQLVAEALDAVLAGIQVDENTWERFVSTELSNH